MTYHHKQDPCLKETKDILAENILQMKKSQYEMPSPTTSPPTSKPEKQEGRENPNVLTGEKSSLLGGEETTEDIENYEPTQEMDFEVDEVKECLEKKKKRRNYIEFRPDYEED